MEVQLLQGEGRRFTPLAGILADPLESLPGSAREKVGVDESVEVAVEDALRVPGFVIGAMVLDDLVGMEDIAADLTSEAGVLHDAALGGQLLLAALLLELGEP